MKLDKIRSHLIQRLRLKDSWIIFFITGTIMLNFPFLGIFNRSVDIAGFPLLFIYLMIGWLFSILVIYTFTKAARNAADGNGNRERK